MTGFENPVAPQKALRRTMPYLLHLLPRHKLAYWNDSTTLNVSLQLRN